MLAKYKPTTKTGGAKSKNQSCTAGLAEGLPIERLGRGMVLWVCVDLLFCAARTDTSSVISSTSRTHMREAARAGRGNGTTAVPGPTL